MVQGYGTAVLHAVIQVPNTWVISQAPNENWLEKKIPPQINLIWKFLSICKLPKKIFELIQLKFGSDEQLLQKFSDKGQVVMEHQ